jgi:hypothetical protein
MRNAAGVGRRGNDLRERAGRRVGADLAPMMNGVGAVDLRGEELGGRALVEHRVNARAASGERHRMREVRERCHRAAVGGTALDRRVGGDKDSVIRHRIGPDRNRFDDESSGCTTGSPWRASVAGAGLEPQPAAKAATVSGRTAWRSDVVFIVSRAGAQSAPM